MSRIVADVIDALYGRCANELDEVFVLDGPGPSNDPGDYLAIGATDPESTSMTSAAEGEDDWAGVGDAAARESRSTLTCVAYSWNGDGDQKAARDAVWRLRADVCAMVRADKSLGVPGVLWLNSSRFSFDQNQGDFGAEARLVFVIEIQTDF